MALEAPFSHWPFSAESNGRPNQHTSRGPAKRYDTNDSPFKGMSPIPSGGRDFGTFPMVDRQSRNLEREQTTHALSKRASQGFLPPSDPVPDNQFVPIPENTDFQQERSNYTPREVPGESPQQPQRGLSLMSRYQHLGREERPVRRSNSLLEFTAFLEKTTGSTSGRPQQQQPQQHQQQYQQQQQHPQQQPQQYQQQQHQPQARRQQPMMVQQEPRGMTVVQQPEYPRHMNGGPKRPTSLQKPAPVAVTKPRPTRPSVRPAPQPVIMVDYPKRPRPREKPRKRNKYAFNIGLVLMVFGFLFFAAFVAALVVLTVVVDAWPTSGLFITGVVIGLLMFLIGMGFLCHNCCVDDDDDDDHRPIFISDPKLATKQNGGLHPVWQSSQRPGQDEVVVPQREELLYPEQPAGGFQRPQEPHQVAPNHANGDARSPVPNGVPTPLAFTTPFQTTPNDYHLY